MDLNDKISLLSSLGNEFRSNEWSEMLVQHAANHNIWYEANMVRTAMSNIASEMLNEEKLKSWISNYPKSNEAKRVGLILAGNIPFVGLQDIISVFLSGHQSVIKLSSKDAFLIQQVIDKLIELNKDCAAHFEIVDKMEKIDAIIATGSNNSYRYFEYYFKDIPHLLRRNRSSIAVLDGSESADQIKGLCEDIFLYFGLGCRSISKLFIPKNYDLVKIREPLEEWNILLDNAKYKNNYDYSYAIYLMNKTAFYALGPGIFLESDQLHSRISCIHFEYYEDIGEVHSWINSNIDEIQCVVGNGLNRDSIPFGTAQKPSLQDYADGIDTMQFLNQISL